jgi:hypothetical protein
MTARCGASRYIGHRSSNFKLRQLGGAAKAQFSPSTHASPSQLRSVCNCRCSFLALSFFALAFPRIEILDQVNPPFGQPLVRYVLGSGLKDLSDTVQY